MILTQFQTVGHDLFTKGLVSSHSGNLSIRLGERLIITRRGSRLNCLEENDLIETGLNKNDRNTPLASVELPVHRAIYRETRAQAIVHAHPPHAVVLSLTEREIVPIDTEGQTIMTRVPVLGWDEKVKPGALGEEIARSFQESRVVLVHGHGTFAIGQLLEEAHNYTTTLEESCQVICLLKSLRGETAPKRSVPQE
ncbi:MAG: aldolase [Dehalococcoidia bacterium]|jgi:L-fuculose-phosphate aldolase